VRDTDRWRRGTFVVEHTPRLWALWAASRPSQLALVLLVYLLGVGIASAGPPVTGASVTTDRTDLARSVLRGALALVPVTVTIHYANEYADGETDALTDPTPFSGGSGALVRTGLPASFLRRATVAAFIAAVFVVLVTVRLGLGRDALALLAAIALFGLAYSLPPFALIRRGLGEVTNAALGGIALPLYGVSVVGAPTPATVLVTLPFALVVGCNLLATPWPDRRADATVGKRTLAVRWSPDRLRLTYSVLAVSAAVFTVGLWIGGLLPNVVALAHLVPVPALVWGGVVLTRQRSPFPAVAAMVLLAAATTAAWWWVGFGGTA